MIPNKPSKGVTDRLKGLEVLVQTIRIHLLSAILVVQERLTPFLDEGATMPDLWASAQLFDRYLSHLGQEIVAADRAHLAEIADDAALRDARDEAANEVSDVLIDLRDSCQRLYGDKNAVKVGFAPETPRDPVVLLEQGETVLERLSSQSPDDFPEPRYPELAVRPEAMVAALTPRVGQLRSALSQVGQERKKAESTLVVKEEAIATFDLHSVWLARWVESILVIAGQRKLAERVRLSSSPRGRVQLAAEDGDTAADAPEPSTGDPTPADSTPGNGPAPQSSSLSGN